MGCALAARRGRGGAEVPGGHLYFAGGAYWSLPADGKGPHNWSPTRKDVAFSLELAYELERAFVAVGGIATGADRPMYQMYSARMGWSLLPGAMTPYLALGA